MILTKEEQRNKFFEEHPLYNYRSNYDWKNNRPTEKRKYPCGDWPLGGIDKLREEIRTRDNHKCQKCGKKWKEGQRRFDVHNIYFNDDYTYKQSRVKKFWKTICHSCHKKIHREQNLTK